MKKVKFNEEMIPEELKQHNQWVGWKYGSPNEKGKRPKIPINPETGGNASVANRKTWGTFEEACQRCEEGGLEGVGFVFTEDDQFIGIDIDDCRDLRTGKLNELAEVLVALKSYTEISPSGMGIKMLAKSKFPVKTLKNDGIEMYGSGRFFTSTGWHLKGTPRMINERSKAIAEIYKIFSPSPKEQAPQKQQEPISHSFTDEKVIFRAMNAPNHDDFKRLLEGNTSKYPSPSEADMAFVGMLVRQIGNNPQQIDRIFRQSKLMRKKWDETHSSDGKTYGEMTIRKAFEGSRQVYLPSTSPCSTEDIIKALEDNEQGDADLYIKFHRDRLCFDHAAQRWYVWHDHSWVEDVMNVALASVMNIATVYQEGYDRLNKQQLEAMQTKSGARKNPDADLMKELDGRIQKLKNLHRREHILKLASAGENSLGITGKRVGCETMADRLHQWSFVSEGRRSHIQGWLSIRLHQNRSTHQMGRH